MGLNTSINRGLPAAAALLEQLSQEPPFLHYVVLSEEQDLRLGLIQEKGTLAFAALAASTMISLNVRARKMPQGLHCLDSGLPGVPNQNNVFVC